LRAEIISKEAELAAVHARDSFPLPEYSSGPSSAWRLDCRRANRPGPRARSAPSLAMRK
jgi:hypothetical protein